MNKPDKKSLICALALSVPIALTIKDGVLSVYALSWNAKFKRQDGKIRIKANILGHKGTKSF